MSETEQQKVESAIQKFSGRNLIAILCATFAAAVWATSMKIDMLQIHKELDHIRDSQDRAQQSTDARIIVTTKWRKDTETELDRRLQERFTASDFNSFAAIFNSQMPVVRVPYSFELHR